MSAHVYPAKRVKGVFYVNGKAISLSDYRLCKYNNLTDYEIKEFKKYLTDYKLI